jgi:ribosomal protein L17
MAPSRKEEQRLVDELWEASRRAYGEARRREICVEWIQHHDRLARGFRDCSERHAREQARYKRILQDMHTNTEGD